MDYYTPEQVAEKLQICVRTVGSIFLRAICRLQNRGVSYQREQLSGYAVTRD